MQSGPSKPKREKIAALKHFLREEKTTPAFATVQKIQEADLLPGMLYFQGHLNSLSEVQQIILLIKLAAYHSHTQSYAQSYAAIQQLHREVLEIRNPVFKAQIDLEKGKYFSHEKKDYSAAITHLSAARKFFRKNKLYTWELNTILHLMDAYISLQDFSEVYTLEKQAQKLIDYDEGTSYQSILYFHLGRSKRLAGLDLQAALESFNECESLITPHLEKNGFLPILQAEKDKVQVKLNDIAARLDEARLEKIMAELEKMKLKNSEPGYSYEFYDGDKNVKEAKGLSKQDFQARKKNFLAQYNLAKIQNNDAPGEKQYVSSDWSVQLLTKKSTP